MARFMRVAVMFGLRYSLLIFKAVCCAVSAHPG